MNHIFRFHSIAVALSLMPSLVACTDESKKVAAPMAMSSQVSEIVVRADKGDVVRELMADGSLYSPQTRSVSVEPVSWFWEFTVTWVANDGALVKKGDLIAKLDSGRIAQDLSERKNRLEQDRLTFAQEKMRASDAIADAEAAVIAAEFALKKAKLSVIDSDSISELERKKQLIDVSTSEAALRKEKARVGETKARVAKDLEVATLRLRNTQDEFNRFSEQIARLQVRAPVEGVLFFPLSPGANGMQKASPGATVNVGRTIAEIANPSDLVVRLYVPEIDSAGLTEGAQAEVTLDIAPEETLRGKVSSVGKLASTESERSGIKSTQPSHNLRQFEVRVQLEHLPANAIPGLTARARIQVANKKAVTRLPIEALLFQGQENAGNAKTKVRIEARSSENGNWEKRDLTIGALSFAFAEVLSGLKPGESVRVKRRANRH